MEAIGIIATILGILAFFFVHPKDAKKAIKGWISEVNSLISRSATNGSQGFNLEILFNKLGINDIKCENIFTNPPLKLEQIRGEYIDEFVEYPEEIKNLATRVISQKKSLAKQQGKTFDNNGSFSLARIDVNRPESASGKRENIYKLILRPTDYEHFVFPNLSLDENHIQDFSEEEDSIRNITGLHKEKLFIKNLENLAPYHFKVGTGTVFITSDNFVILSVRSRKQLVAPDRKNGFIQIHLSAAEGMYRSVSNYAASDLYKNEPNPFATSSRSLSDELNLEEGVHYNISEIQCLGYLMDQKRAQPFFLFYLKSKRISLDDYFNLLSTTPTDEHENDAIIALEWTVENILQLFKERPTSRLHFIAPPFIQKEFLFLSSDKKVQIASNHARSGLALSLWKDFKSNDIIEKFKK